MPPRLQGSILLLLGTQLLQKGAAQQGDKSFPPFSRLFLFEGMVGLQVIGLANYIPRLVVSRRGYSHDIFGRCFQLIPNHAQGSIPSLITLPFLVDKTQSLGVGSLQVIQVDPVLLPNPLRLLILVLRITRLHGLVTTF